MMPAYPAFTSQGRCAALSPAIYVAPPQHTHQFVVLHRIRSICITALRQETDYEYVAIPVPSP